MATKRETYREFDISGNCIKETVVEYGEGETTEPEVQKNVVKFRYHGVLREVENPQISKGAYDPWSRTYGTLLSGIELTRAGRDSGAFKHFRVEDIQPV